MRLIVQRLPVQFAGKVPFKVLPKLLPHKEQLFAGVSGHVAVKSAQLGKLLVVFAGHFVDQAALAVHHLVVTDGQDKVLAERVEKASLDYLMNEKFVQFAASEPDEEYPFTVCGQTKIAATSENM